MGRLGARVRKRLEESGSWRAALKPWTRQTGPWASRASGALAELARDPQATSTTIFGSHRAKIRVYDDNSSRRGADARRRDCSPSKYELARMLSRTSGSHHGRRFPSVSESERETLRLILEGRKRGEIRPDLEVVCMTRIDQGATSTPRCASSTSLDQRDEVTYFIFTSASDLHVKYKLGKTLLHRDGIPGIRVVGACPCRTTALQLRMMCEAISYARAQAPRAIRVRW